MSGLCFFFDIEAIDSFVTLHQTPAVTHGTCLTQALAGSVGMRGISNYSHGAELKYLHLD